MKKMFTSALILSLCVVTAGCDSVGTKEVKRDAKAIDKSYEAQADLIEASQKYAPSDARQQASERADALRNEGEAIKDRLISEAKEVQRETRKAQ